LLIAQISDTHILAPGSDHAAAELRADCLRRCIADINVQQPDAVILTGDTVQFGRADEYARLRKLLAPLKAPLYFVPGNRDDKHTLGESFADTPFAEDAEFIQYTVEGHELRLVGIDSTLACERKGVFCTARQEWLEAVLSDQPDQATLLFIHHPPFDIEDHYIGGYRRPAEATALESIVSRHSQVEALLCGHVHCPVDRAWAGTRAKVMPSVAVDVRKGIDESEAQGAPIYMLHRYSDETGLASELKVVG
jgi:3',5'-cyclic AMP phosphodiesterase CpdA